MNAFSHFLHLKGKSPVCVTTSIQKLICMSRCSYILYIHRVSPLCEYFCGSRVIFHTERLFHIVYIHRASPVWLLLCVLRALGEMNVSPQSLHLYTFSWHFWCSLGLYSMWHNMCLLRDEWLKKNFPHALHSLGLKPAVFFFTLRVGISFTFSPQEWISFLSESLS